MIIKADHKQFYNISGGNECRVSRWREGKEEREILVVVREGLHDKMIFELYFVMD